jgi:carboxylesterase type B
MPVTGVQTCALPIWPRYDAETRPTMLFNDTCSVENRPADDEVSLWEGVV